MILNKKPPGLWTGQIFHFGTLSVLLGATWVAWSYMGKPFPNVFWSAVGIPIAHQIDVWLCWRLQLKSDVISRTIGFRGYIVGFFILFGGRFLSLLFLATRDSGSAGLPPLARISLTIVSIVLGAYAMYSTMRYFGMKRAAGADHFDQDYRDMPLVKKGIFRYTNNGMYLYAFLLFWAVAIGFDSSATLLAAAFSHIFIWNDSYATEKPDMDYLYG